MVRKENAMNASDQPTDLMLSEPALLSWTWLSASDVLHPQSISSETAKPNAPSPSSLFSRRIDLLQPLRYLLNHLDVHNPPLAHRICQMIPSQCPFERDVQLFGQILFHIPPLCKLNPLYEELVTLRFRALCYLADECGEDITPYC